MVPLCAFTTPMPVGIDVWKVLGLASWHRRQPAARRRFRRAEAAKVAVAEYTGLIWAAILGYVFFAEVPRSMVWVGGGLVIAGCLIVRGAAAARHTSAA